MGIENVGTERGRNVEASVWHNSGLERPLKIYNIYSLRHPFIFGQKVPVSS